MRTCSHGQGTKALDSLAELCPWALLAASPALTDSGLWPQPSGVCFSTAYLLYSS